MKITLFGSNRCPRCFLARKHLFEIAGDKPDIQIEEVHITNIWLAAIGIAAFLLAHLELL